MTLKSLKSIPLIIRVLFKVRFIYLVFLLGSLLCAAISGTNLYAQNHGQKVLEEEIVLNENKARQIAAVWNEDSYRHAQMLYEKTARDWLLTGNYQSYAACLREAARLNISLNEFNKAWQMLMDSLVAERKIHNISGESETLSDLTLIALWKKNRQKAQELQKQSFILAEKSKKPRTLAKANFAAAQYNYRYETNLPLMTKLQEKSLQFFREANDKSGEVQTLTELAYTEVMNNNPIKGQNYAVEAVNLARTIGLQRELALALIALGDAHQRMSNWQEAIQSFKEAESLYPENLDFYEKAILFVRFGFYNETFGDLAQARSYFIKAHLFFIKTGNLFGNSELTTRIGQISRQLGANNDAFKSFQEGLQIGFQSKDFYSIAYAYENIGELLFSEQKYQNALSYYKKALSNYEKVGIKHAVATVKEKIGKLYLKLNNRNSAEKFYLESLQINRNIRSKTGEATNLYNLALLYQSANQIDKSLEQITDCLDLTDFLHGETANVKLRQSYLSEVYSRYELFISLLMKKNEQFPNQNFATKALQASEWVRARSTLEMIKLSEANITKDAVPETVKREKEIRILLNAKADKLTNLLSINADQAETEKLDNDINELEHELEEIKAALKQSSPNYSAVKNPAPFDVAEFQKNVLDENSLLLEFSFGKEESYLWLVGKTEINSIILPPRAEIESHIEKLRELLTSREIKQGEFIESYQARISEAENIYKIESKQLSDKLFGQIADKISNKRLIIVPDGKLHYFPIAALPFPNSTAHLPILMTNETVYEPSASTLALLMQNGKQISASPKDLLIFSDPIFSIKDERITPTGTEKQTQPETGILQTEKFRFAESLTSLARLSASQDEADAILQIIGESASTALGGAAATRERALDASISDYKIIHFATHGLINEERPELSGIVMSQFDETGQNLKGVVRLQDIYEMNLSADTVVLSACNTGIGKEVKGEGLLSLNNAFLQAGAKTVVSSLWKVDDYAAQELMKNFYLELTTGSVTTSKALQRAQIKMWQSSRYKSPFYWAAFKVEGNFQTAPKLSGGFGYWIYMLLIFPLLFLGMYVYSRKSRLLNNKIIIDG